MKVYESVIIVNSSLNEDTLNRIISRYEDIIKKHDGNLKNTERWGKRRLAYPIKKFRYGFYIIFEFEASSGLITDLEREYRLSEHILRFMTLHKDKKALLAEKIRKEKALQKTVDEEDVNGKDKASDKESPHETAGKAVSESMTSDETETAVEPVMSVEPVIDSEKSILEEEDEPAQEESQKPASGEPDVTVDDQDAREPTTEKQDTPPEEEADAPEESTAAAQATDEQEQKHDKTEETAEEEPTGQ